MTSKAISPYAQAIFEITSKDIAPTDQITEDLLAIRDLFIQTPELNEYFNNPTVSKDAKYKLLRRLFNSTRLHPLTYNFLRILVKRDRINLLRPIVAKYMLSSREFSSYKIVTISIAFRITDEQEERIIDKLGELTQARTVELTGGIDSNLIGGFVLTTGSKVIDFSVKNKLQMLAKHLDTVLEI